MKKQQTYKGVEVYEVGIQQLYDLVGDVLVNDARIGDYVVVGGTSMFGLLVPGVWAYVDRCTSLDDVVTAVQRNNENDLAMIREYGCRFAMGREVWHIVDDGDLWQAWDYDSARACREGGQPTDYHVYDGRVCVLDLVREVPSTLYAVTYVNDADRIVNAEWYVDADTWAGASTYAKDMGFGFFSLEYQQARELGICVVDDWDHDEGLADAITVLNVYFRV